MANHLPSRAYLLRLLEDTLWIHSARLKAEGKTRATAVAGAREVGKEKLGTDYPDLAEVGKDAFSCPMSRLYLTVLGTLSGTIAFRDMDVDEIHEEMVRRAGEIEGRMAGCH